MTTAFLSRFLKMSTYPSVSAEIEALAPSWLWSLPELLPDNERALKVEVYAASEVNNLSLLLAELG